MDSSAMQRLLLSRRATLCLTLFLIAGGEIPVYASQTDIPGPSGSGQFGFSVTVLPNASRSRDVGQG